METNIFSGEARKHKNVFSDIPLVVSLHADNFGFICSGSEQINGGERKFVYGAHKINKFHFKKFNSYVSFLEIIQVIPVKLLLSYFK